MSVGTRRKGGQIHDNARGERDGLPLGHAVGLPRRAEDVVSVHGRGVGAVPARLQPLGILVGDVAAGLEEKRGY